MVSKEDRKAKKEKKKVESEEEESEEEVQVKAKKDKKVIKSTKDEISEDEDGNMDEEEREKVEKRARKKAEKIMRKEKKAAKAAAEDEAWEEKVEEGEEGEDGEEVKKEDQEAESKREKKRKQKREEEAVAGGDGGEEGGEGKKKEKNTGTKRGSEAGRLDEATLPYVKEVTALAKADEFEEAEDRSLFVENVWRELKMGKQEQLVRLITHREGSNAVESLLHLSTPAQLYRVVKTLSECMARVIFNPYGSHVLEALFKYIPKLVNSSMAELVSREEGAEESDEDDKEGKAQGDLKSLEQLFQEVCDEITGGWFEIMTDARGSHVLRAIVKALSGLEPKLSGPPGGNGKGKGGGKGAGAGSMREADWIRKKVPKSFGDRLRSVVGEVCSEDNLEELSAMALNSAAGPLLQLILLAVRSDKTLATTVCRAVLRWPAGAASPPSDWVGKLSVDESGSHMMEAVMEALNDEDRFTVVTVCFKGKLVQLCRHRLANHVMQRVIDRATGEPEVRTLMQELSPHIAELFQWNRPGVVKSLSDACARSGACQAEFLKAVTAALRVSGPKDNHRIIPSVLNLREAPEGFEDVKGPKANVLGSMLLQAMVKFEESQIQSLLGAFAGLSEAYVAALATDSAGSRALEGFLASPTVPNKAKFRLVDRVAARAPKIGADKFGSHIVEACYQKSGIDRKKTLVAALAAGSNELRASFYGTQVYKRCRVEQFSNKSDEWEEGEVSNAKKRSMFEDLLASDDEEGDAKLSGDKRPRHVPGEARPEKKEKKSGGKKAKKGDGLIEAAEAMARKVGGRALDGALSELGYSEGTSAKGSGKKEKVSSMEKKRRQRAKEDETLEKTMGSKKGGDDEIDDLFESSKKKSRNGK